MPAPLPQPLPLFPLPDVVLFPHTALPLHIFEPRYRKMVADVFESHRTIGMALLRPGWEADYYGRPPVFAVGGAGLIERFEPLADGRFNILLRGTTRYRILEEHGGYHPYRVATVAALAEAPADERALAQARKELLAGIGRATDGPTAMVLQSDLPHELFAMALCQSFDLAPLEKQALLECDGALARYRRLLQILEFRRLEQAWGAGGRSQKPH
ncbi:MAG TPA: LON peptidase substrate-binding domain-containing protein [Vicinamibacteria bacterium]